MCTQSVKDNNLGIQSIFNINQFKMTACRENTIYFKYSQLMCKTFTSIEFNS